MASPLYYATIVGKNKATVTVKLSIVHPDISEFGTDRLFAWKLLHEYVAGADDGTDVELASKYVKAVKLSPVTSGKVAKKATDFVTVKRVGNKNPTVTYTIEMTDESLLADISKGDSDEVYDYVEPGKGKALTPPPVGRPERAGSKQITARGPDKAYEDLREAALQLLAKSTSWSDYVIEHGLLSRWAKTATEDQIVGWIGRLDKNFQSYGAGVLAVERVDLGKQLLKLAESKYKPKDDYGGFYALHGLIPAWWKYGKAKQADAAFKRIADEMSKNDTDANQRAHTLFTIAARGGQWDKASALVKECFNDNSDYRDDLLEPGVAAAFIAGEKKLCEAIMKKWSACEPSSKASDLSQDLLRHFLDSGEPEKYFDVLFKWPAVIDNYDTARYALAQIEAKAPKLAVAIADKLVGRDEDVFYLESEALAIYARHAKPKAAAWRKKHQSKLDDMIPELAAAGHDVRKLLKNATESQCSSVGHLTADRELAIDALVAANTKGYNPTAYMLGALADLGAREQVDQILEKQLAKIGKLATKERDLPCRYLAAAAVQVGRADLAFAACKLPGPAMRQYSAGDLVNGAVACGDFTSALAALQLVPDDGSNGRVSSAIQGLRRADEAFVTAPRAVPLRAMDATYVRGLITAKARATLETVLAIARELPDDVRVEVDAFLDGRAFAPR